MILAPKKIRLRLDKQRSVLPNLKSQWLSPERLFLQLREDEVDCFTLLKSKVSREVFTQRLTKADIIIPASMPLLR